MITKEKKECYISGDFNIDLLKYDTNNNSSEFLNSMSSAGFLPSILQPTRITDDTSTIIDNIYTNNVNQSSLSGNILISFADHLTQFISVQKKTNNHKPYDIFKRDFANFDEQSFKNDVSIQNWNSISLTDANEKLGELRDVQIDMLL